MRISSDFADLLREFNAARVDYLIVGAHAVARYARPRATGDFDVFIDAAAENATRVYDALIRFGAPLHGIDVADFTSDDLVFQIGVEPVRIDILTAIDGVTFQAAFARRETGILDGIPVAYIGRDDLIANKRAAGRPKDLADLRRLEADQ
ncbi:MAG: hypothetical protein NVSMB64_22360 [Candidatus Velthaea sp.]